MQETKAYDHCISYGDGSKEFIISIQTDVIEKFFNFKNENKCSSYNDTLNLLLENQRSKTQSVEHFYNISWLELNTLLRKYVEEGKRIASFCYNKTDNESVAGIITGYSYDGIIVFEDESLVINRRIRI